MNYVFEFKPVWMKFYLIKEGILFTVFVSVAAIAIGLVLGIIAASCKTSHIKILSTIATFYIELIRNTPLLVQLWLFYFGLVEFGINLTALTCGVLALGINTGAYAGEVIRAGLESIDKEIIDAAASLGFSDWNTLVKIKLPLALRTVLPSLGNIIIQCLLASALLSVLGINELTNQALRISNMTFRSFETFIVIAFIYIILNFIYTGIIELIRKKTCKGSLH